MLCRHYISVQSAGAEKKTKHEQFNLHVYVCIYIYIFCNNFNKTILHIVALFKVTDVKFINYSEKEFGSSFDIDITQEGGQA
jgi:hypothetical protein